MIGKILSKMNFGNTLYYPGCLTHHVLPDIERNYEKILRMLGIDFIFLPGFNCCGSPVKNAGYKK
jgi:Fe-S oxidoreductase